MSGKNQKIIKVMHIMKEYANNEGILSVPAIISCMFERYLKETSNVVLVTRNIGSLSKSKAKVQEEGEIHPIIKHTPNLISVLHKILSFKPDTVLIHQHLGSFFELFLQTALKVLRVKTIIGLDLVQEHFVSFKHKSFTEFIGAIKYYICIFLQLHLADRIFCRTKNEIDIISSKMAISKNKYFVIPPGHDFEIEKQQKENYILAVSGWWSDRKNLHTILRVFSEVIKKKECKLVIVGEFFKGRYKILDEKGEMFTDKYETGEEYKQRIMRLIGELRLKDHIEFVGIKKGKELQDIYKKALIYYMPSKSEGFGMVWVEAMASGTPIVAMPNSAVKYIVKDGITGFLRDTPSGQKDAILKLLTDNELYAKMQENCLKEAEKYKWENIINKWKEVI